MNKKFAIFNILVFMLFLFLNTACTLSDATEMTQPTAPVLEEITRLSPTMMPTEIVLSLPTLPPSEPMVTPEPTATATVAPEIVPEVVEQTIEIPNLADATVYLHPNSTFSNFGDSKELTLGADSDGNPYYILLDFELSGFIPANATIKEANLNITASDTVFWGFPFAVFPIEEEWQEGTVMGENLPSYNQELSFQFDLDESNPSMSFPITEIVQGWVDGTIDAHGVLLSANVIQNTAKFHSVEGVPAYRPTLEVIYEGPVIPLVINELSQPERLPDFTSPEEVVVSALQTWNSGDQAWFTRHFYLGSQDAEPAWEALSICNLQTDNFTFLTNPATDIGPQMSNVILSFDGSPIGTFLVIGGNRFRITRVTMSCSN